MKMVTQQVRTVSAAGVVSSLKNSRESAVCVSQAGADELQMLSGLGSDDTVDLLQILNSSPQELAR